MHDALREVDGLLKAGHTWVVDADIKATSTRSRTMHYKSASKNRFSDGRILKLIGQFLKQGIMDEMTGGFPKKEHRKGLSSARCCRTSTSTHWTSK